MVQESKNSNKMANPTYKYKTNGTILGPVEADDFSLTEIEFYCLYSFFVTCSMCGGQSRRKRELKEYAWNQNDVRKSGFRNAMNRVLPLDKSRFVIVKKGTLKDAFDKNNLSDGIPDQIDVERAVLNNAYNNESQYFQLFGHIRNVFAHGNYSLRYNSHREKTVIMQDADKYNVTARIILKLDTLINIIKVTDKAGLIIAKIKEGAA